MAVLLLLLLLTATQAMLFMRGQTPVWSVLLMGFALAAYLSAAVFWISKPYRRAEKTMERFLDGYIIPAGDREKEVLLTPTTAEEMKAMDLFLHSPQMMDLNKRQAQYLALQNQINPHFLYNTLETIRSEAIMNGAVNAGTMAEALATFFRYTISNLDYLVQIEDELENIQNYFTIQHYRFGNKIGIQITYDEEDKNILRLYIPKLIMQPVVENAIYHGIEQKLGAGQVTISISYTKQNLDIMISDDGIGIKDTELSEINNRLWTDSENYGYEKSEKSGGIAIRNVNQRIKLLFGEEYGIWLNSIYGIGTDVHIKLPVVLTPDDLEKKLRIDKEDVGGQSGKGTGTL